MCITVRTQPYFSCVNALVSTAWVSAIVADGTDVRTRDRRPGARPMFSCRHVRCIEVTAAQRCGRVSIMRADASCIVTSPTSLTKDACRRPTANCSQGTCRLNIGEGQYPLSAQPENHQPARCSFELRYALF